ncbi:hypothetical protein PV325_006796 [Microctonus aethiopoides]|nr:hypothetical protein PV325_006796 [Microctonus aethiopoides]
MSIHNIRLTHNDDEAQEHTHIPYKKIKWRKFSKELLNIHANEVPNNRNLLDDEIDTHIETLIKDINSVLMRQAIKGSNNAKSPYINNKNLIRLHKLKSNLLTELNKLRKYDPGSQKVSTKLIKKELNISKKMILQEITTINEKKWKNLHKIIEHNAPDKVFPIVKKMLKPNSNIKISTLLIDNDKKNLISKVKDSIKIVMKKDKQLCVTSEIDKVNVLAAHYELVNSPNNLNNNTRLREIIEKKVNNFNIETKKYKEVNNRQILC